MGFLIGKMVEESLETREASEENDERLLELADLFEVLRALGATSNVGMEDIEAAAQKKREKVGGFDEAHLLLETSIPGPDDTNLRTTVVSDQGALLVSKQVQVP